MPRPHAAQREIIANARRYSVLACGRRFGKTTLLMDRAIAAMLAGQPVGWFAPTYKLLMDAWRVFVQRLQPVMRSSNASEHRMQIVTGGGLECWTLEDNDAGRSRKYARVIIDEAGLQRNLSERWHAAIRPTLADLSGDAWLAGTPKGRNDFWQLWQLGLSGDPDWVSWQRPTDANPHIPPSEIADMRASLPALIVAQEVDAEFVESDTTLFREADILRAHDDSAPCEPIPLRQYITAVDVGRRQDATVISTFDMTQRPYRRVAWSRLERIPYPRIQAAIDERATQYPGRLLVESNGVGDPVVENLTSPAEPFITTARSKLQALQSLQLLFERGDLRAAWDARERTALLAAAWDDSHTADEVMSLAIAASVLADATHSTDITPVVRRASRWQTI